MLTPAPALTGSGRPVPPETVPPEGEPELERLLQGGEAEGLERPLSPTRLQPLLPPEAQRVPEFEEVARVLAEMPRPLKRRGSMEQSPGPALPPTRTRQYQQLITRLLHRPPRRDEPLAPGDTGASSDLPPPAPAVPEARPPRHSPPLQSPSSPAPAPVSVCSPWGATVSRGAPRGATRCPLSLRAPQGATRCLVSLGPLWRCHEVFGVPCSPPRCHKMPSVPWSPPRCQAVVAVPRASPSVPRNDNQCLVPPDVALQSP